MSLRLRVTYDEFCICPGYTCPCGLRSIDIPERHRLPIFVCWKRVIADFMELIIASCGKEVYIFLMSAQ